MKKIFIIAIALLLGVRMHAQDVYNNNVDTTKVAPIVSSRLQGAREATEAEKEYARRMAEAREQQQIDRNLPLLMRTDKPLQIMICIILIGDMDGVRLHGVCIKV